MFVRKKKFHDILDELDRVIDGMEDDIENMLKNIYESGSKFLPKPIVYGLSMKVDPNGEPILKLFGDRNLLEEGFREPVYDQIINKDEGKLKLFIELPGVEKKDIELNVLEDEATISAIHDDIKYKARIKFKASVDPTSGSASCHNGVLEATFKLKNKNYKRYTKIKVE